MVHRVRQGECLASIARLYGLYSWREIWDNPANAAFRERRINPNVLHPGDHVVIPDSARRLEDGSTEERHRFRVKSEPTRLRILLQDETRQVAAGKRYELVVGEIHYAGLTGSDGFIDHEIPPLATSAVLTVFLNEAVPVTSWRLALGALDPHDADTGAQARLNNLGFACGAIDGIIGPRTRAATLAFQRAFGLHPDGVLGPETRRKLREAHGC